MEREKLTIEDLQGCAKDAIQRDGKLNDKQLTLIAKKGNDNLGTYYFWNWFVSKYGVPNYGQRGFSANPEQFARYYFEDLNTKTI